MEIRQFRRQYDLELIPASHEGIILGTLVWDPIIGKPKFNHPGTSSHVFNAFRTANLIDNKELISFTDAIQDTPLKPAQFGTVVREIEIDIDVVGSLENAKISEIETALGREKVKKFSFADLEVRVMSNLERVRIYDFLEELKKNQWEEYDGKLRRLFMITELYYGSVKMVIDSSLKTDLDSKLALNNIQVGSEMSLGNRLEYTFEHKNVPFAMRLERVKKFIA